MNRKTKTEKFSLENVDLGKRLESLNPKIKREGEREAMLSRRANHNHTTFLIYSKFTKELQTVFVLRGQFFTTYNRLAKIWRCSKDQARYQLKKWKESGVAKVEIKKDQKGFDIGLLITYNWLYNQQKPQREKRRSKIPIRETANKSDKIKDKKIVNSKIPTHNKEVLPKGNIQEGDVFFGKSKEEKKQIKKIKKEFAEIKINPKIANQIFETYDLNLILDYLKLLNITDGKIKNKAGWLVQALKQSYDLQKVENWKDQKKELEKKQKAEKEAELEAIKLQKEQDEKQAEEEKLIKKWKVENGEQVEKKIYLNIFEELERTNRIIYTYLIRKKPQDQDLFSFLKKDCYIKSMVKKEILEEVKKMTGVLA